MEVIGNGRVVFTKPQDEKPHAPTSEENWQESVVIYLWDAEQQVYVFFRLGHEPNRGPNGSAVIWNNVWANGQYHKYYDTVPLQPGDRFDSGFATGTQLGNSSGMQLRYEYSEKDGGRHHWTMKDGDVSADLVMEDWHEPFDFWPAKNNLAEVAPNHTEACGRITGTVRFKGKTYKITNGVGHRDHSWGYRRWDVMLTHRWMPAIFGPDFFTHTVTMLTDDGKLGQLGFVVRDGKFYVPTKIVVGCFVEADGLTNRGGNAIYTLPDGEQLEVVFWNITPGAVSFHRGFCGFDPMSAVSCGDRTGFGVMETSNNSMNGQARPDQKILVSGYIDNGIFPYQHGTSLIQRSR